jgi:predicted DNA binding CopG/RHH family protein
MNEDIDIVIEQKEAQLSSLRSLMEQLKNEFIKAMTDFASEWFKTTTREYVSKYPEVTLKMREEKIVQMKANVSELIRNTEKVVKAEFENPALWWHQSPRLLDPIDQYLQVADKYPEILDRAVRHVLGRLGLILEKYGFNVCASGNTGSYGEFWFDHPKDDQTTSIPYYPHLLNWSEKMQNTIKNYNSQYVKAMEEFNEIQSLKNEKKKQEAMNRWDSI